MSSKYPRYINGETCERFETIIGHIYDLLFHSLPLKMSHNVYLIPYNNVTIICARGMPGISEYMYIMSVSSPQRASS